MVDYPTVSHEDSLDIHTMLRIIPIAHSNPKWNAVLTVPPIGQEARGAWGRFSANYLFRHTAVLYAAVLVCAFAEDVR